MSNPDPNKWAVLSTLIFKQQKVILDKIRYLKGGTQGDNIRLILDEHYKRLAKKGMPELKHELDEYFKNK